MAGITEQDFEPFDAPPTAPSTPSPRGVTPITTKEGRPQITIHPRPKEITEQDFEPFDSKDQPAASTQPFREVGPAEAFARGGIDIATYGAGPALTGTLAAGAAGKTPEQQAAEIQPGTDFPGLEMAGAGLHRVFSGDPEALSAYHSGRESALNDRNLAENQQRVPFLLGQLTSALTLPGGAMFKGATAMTRIGLAALIGAIQNALQSTGEAVSEAKPPGEIATEAAKGAATGGVLGTAGGTVLEAAGKIGSNLAGIVRGKRDPDLEAGRRIVDSLRGEKSAFAPEEGIEAAHAGTPIGIVDLGQTRTRALARSAANTSPEARQALEALTGAGEESGRFQTQSPRIAGAIRRLTGGAQASTDMETLERAARKVNKPRYEAAYAAGDRPIWDNPNPRPGVSSNELEKLVSTNAVKRAIAGAAERGKDRAIADDINMGAFRPSISVDSQGGVQFARGPTGVPTYPNIQFWDYVQRELKDQIGNLKDKNAFDQADVVKTLRDRLLKELDHQVPEFGRARETAANFFGAEDALEAGQKFVMTGEDIPGAVRALSRMSAPERELFARGFASDLADKIERIGYNQNVLNSVFLNNFTARRKIQIALGPARADQLEALLRSEAVIDKARKAMLGTTTARQLAESGLAGGGAVAAYETLKGEDFNPGAILAGAIGLHGARHGLQKIDQKVAQRVGEMLASNDITQLERALKTISHSQPLMDALRRATGATVRVGARDVGFTNLAAGATVAAEDLAGLFKKHEKAPHHETENLQYQDQTQ